MRCREEEEETKREEVGLREKKARKRASPAIKVQKD